MRHLITALILTLTCSTAAAQSCGAYLQAFTLWEDEVGREIVLKHSLFPLVDWDPNSQFDGVVLTKSAEKQLSHPILEVEFRSIVSSKKKMETFRELRPFQLDADLKQFNDFQPEEFFSFSEPGKFTIRLKSKDKVICSERHSYSLGH